MRAACRSSVVDLRDLADRLAALAAEHTGPRAILLTGSVARGDADEYSDVDLILYYDVLPDEAGRESIRTGIGGGDRQVLGAEEAGFVEQYVVKATYCQLAHITVERWDDELARAVANHRIVGALLEREHRDVIGLHEQRVINLAKLIALDKLVRDHKRRDQSHRRDCRERNRESRAELH